MSITGVIKVLDVPDDACLTTVRDLVLQLEKYLAVEFDEEKITNVFVSYVEPDTTSRDVLWFRLDASGNFIGLFVFVQGQWFQMFPPPQQIIRMYGRSDDLPIGYALADATVAGISAAMAAHLKGTPVATAPPDPDNMGGWLLHPDEPTVYVIFDVVYVGV